MSANAGAAAPGDHRLRANPAGAPGRPAPPEGARGGATFTVTALCARRLEDAASFRLRGEGPPPRPPVLAANDPLSAPHVYVSDFQPEPLPGAVRRTTPP